MRKTVQVELLSDFGERKAGEILTWDGFKAKGWSEKGVCRVLDPGEAKPKKRRKKEEPKPDTPKLPDDYDSYAPTTYGGSY